MRKCLLIATILMLGVVTMLGCYGSGGYSAAGGVPNIYYQSGDLILPPPGSGRQMYYRSGNLILPVPGSKPPGLYPNVNPQNPPLFYYKSGDLILPPPGSTEGFKMPCYQTGDLIVCP
jgi:hypothetical protein